MIPPPLPSLRPLPRRDPDVSAIVKRWRALTSGRGPGGRLGSGEPTLVACSGGADSSALVLALAAATRSIILAHVVHDLRPEPEALADRDAVRALASGLGLAFVERRVGTRDLTIDGRPAPPELVRRAGDRNAEGLARRLRYLALEDLARGNALGFIATAHHAGDQLESILMALARGAGPRGMRGVLPTRPASQGSEIRVIRPMLGIPRDACERLCRDAGWAWREDTTNADTTRLRAFMRHRVIPELRAVRPSIERRAGSAAELLADAASLVHDRAAGLLDEGADATGGPYRWSRLVLRAETHAVLGELLSLAMHRLDARGCADRLGRARLDAVVACIRSPRPHRRSFELGSVVVRIEPREVVLHARGPVRASRQFHDDTDG